MLAVVVAVSAHSVLGQSITADTSVARVGDYVERYYARAQSIIVDENVAIQPLGLDSEYDGFARRLTYELRVEWNPDADNDDSPAKVTRQLIAVNGRPPKPNQEPECLDPRSTSPEPLAFLLPERREKFIFKAAGLGRVGAREAVMIDYRSVKPEDPKVEWKEECVSIDLPGRARGRIWADPETSEILRLDEGIVGLVDITVPRKQQRPGGPTYMTIERADSTIRYRPCLLHRPGRDPPSCLAASRPRRSSETQAAREHALRRLSPITVGSSPAPALSSKASDVRRS